VGTWYEDFTQVEDAEVRELLEKARLGWGVAVAQH
jgi:predicted phosphoribosyltransferase